MKNVVVVRAGPKSFHKSWISKSEALRKFDIFVCCYSNNVLEVDSPGLTHFYSPGTKIEGLNNFIKQKWFIIEQYERIAFIDDDIQTFHENIHKCFEIGLKENFAIWQPSLTWSSYFTYAGTLQVKGLSVRYVNFVEMMAPFFKVDALFKIKDLFDMGLESGIDLVWCNLLAPEICGIIDEAPVFHTRPVGSKKEDNGFIDRKYEDDIKLVLNKYGYIWPSLVSRGAKKTNGLLIGKAVCTIFSLQLVLGIFYSPNKKFFKLFSDHIRHLITRPFHMRLKEK